MFGSSESYPNLMWRFWSSLFGGDPVIAGVALFVLIFVIIIAIVKISDKG